MPMDTDKSPQQKPNLLGKGPEKGQPTNTENLYTRTALIQLNTTEKSVVPSGPNIRGQVGV